MKALIEFQDRICRTESFDMDGKTAWFVVYDLTGCKDDILMPSVARLGGKPCFTRAFPDAPYLCVTQLDSTIISFRPISEAEIDRWMEGALENRHLVAQDMLYALEYNIEESAKRLRALQSGLGSVKDYLTAHIERVVADLP